MIELEDMRIEEVVVVENDVHEFIKRSCVCVCVMNNGGFLF